MQFHEVRLKTSRDLLAFTPFHLQKGHESSTKMTAFYSL